MAGPEEIQRIQRAWLEKAERFLRTARQARRDGDYESSVSRAYYALFHSITALLPEVQGFDSTTRVLDYCADWNQRHTRFNAVGVLRGQRDLRRSLRELYSWREDADYKLSKTDQQRARDALDFANRFVAVVKEQLS